MLGSFSSKATLSTMLIFSEISSTVSGNPLRLCVEHMTSCSIMFPLATSHRESRVDGSSKERKRSQSHKQKTEESVQGVNQESICFYRGNEGHLAPNCLVTVSRKGKLSESVYLVETITRILFIWISIVLTRPPVQQQLYTPQLMQMFPPQMFIQALKWSIR